MTNKATLNTSLPLPEGLFKGHYQSGITDPRWPKEPPAEFDPKAILDIINERIGAGRLREEDADILSLEDVRNSYTSDYSGRISKQKNISIMRANCLLKKREDLQNLLKTITEFASEEIRRIPSVKHLRILEAIPDSYRVTISLGIGATLFTTLDGFDRYGISHHKPRYLKPMPSFLGDSEELDPSASASDFIFLISSDHPYINVAIVRFFAEYLNKRFSKNYGFKGKAVEFLGVEEGFQRKDTREFLGFDDGIDNISMREDELERLVYITQVDNEPDWCINGTYLVYRKIRERMPDWEKLTVVNQEAMIGRDKETGKPLSRQVTGPKGKTPVYSDSKDPADGALNSHIRKVQPRRNSEDLFGIDDLDRRFLRRPYPFFDGLDESGNSINGLQFLAFMKSIQQQFEHVVNMWQLNPDFPVQGAGIDALYANNILETLDGGYYFCPPGLASPKDYFASGLFRE
ncbi:Dyp-type peroxidase [Hellea sp.]|nr:Dyp-type peroxidase [Hellea sp.]